LERKLDSNIKANDRLEAIFTFLKSLENEKTF